MPPDIAGIKLVLTISSSCFSWSVMCGIVPIRYVGFCLNLIIEHEYAACGPYHAILLNMHNSVSNGRFFLSCSFADTVICSSDDCSEIPFAFCCDFYMVCLKMDLVYSSPYFLITSQSSIPSE